VVQRFASAHADRLRRRIHATGYRRCATLCPRIRGTGRTSRTCLMVRQNERSGILSWSGWYVFVIVLPGALGHTGAFYVPGISV
jgi:hypothetical protein